jgi:hypothetical protein
MITYSSVELKRVRFPFPFRYTSLQLFIYKTRVMVVFLLLALTFRSLRASIIVVGFIVGPSSNCPGACSSCHDPRFILANALTFNQVRRIASLAARASQRRVPVTCDDS